MALLVSAAGLRAQPDNLPEGLLLHLPLDGHARDGSGRGHHGEAREVTFDYLGREGGLAAEFRRPDSAIVVRRSAELDLQKAVTLSAWVRIAPRQDGGPVAYKGRLFFYWNYGLFAKADGVGYMKSSGSGGVRHPLNDGVWHQVAVAVDEDAGRLACYLDGRRIVPLQVFDGTFDVEKIGDVVADSGPGGDLQVGSDSSVSSADGRLDGALADLRIHGRALGDGEIRAL